MANQSNQSNDAELKSYLMTEMEKVVEPVEQSKVVISEQIPKGYKPLHVQTTILFADIRGSTRMSKAIGKKKWQKFTVHSQSLLPKQSMRIAESSSNSQVMDSWQHLMTAMVRIIE